MKFQIDEDLNLVPIQNVSQASPSPVVSSSLLPAPELPNPSSFIDSPLTLQQLVDCNFLQNHQPQLQPEQLTHEQLSRKLMPLLQNQQRIVEPPRSHKLRLSEQDFRYTEPQPMQSTIESLAIDPYPQPQQQISLGDLQPQPPASNHYQLQQQQLGTLEPLLQNQHDSIQHSMSRNNPYQLQHQQLSFLDSRLQYVQAPRNGLQPPPSSNYQRQQQHIPFPERPLQIGVQTPQEVSQTRNQLPLLSQSRPSDVANLSFNRASIKGKEKVTSSPPRAESLSYAPEQSQVLRRGHGTIMGGRSNLYSGARGREDFRHHRPPLPGKHDIASESINNPGGSTALLEFLHALKECSPPGSDISDPCEETRGPIFDIPFFFGNTMFSGLADRVDNLTSRPLAYNEEVLRPSRKGKEVMVRGRQK